MTTKPHRLTRLYRAAKKAHGHETAQRIVQRVYRKKYGKVPTPATVEKYSMQPEEPEQVAPAPGPAPVQQASPEPATAHKLYGKLCDRGYSSLAATKIAMKVKHLFTWTGKPKKYCATCDKYDCQHTVEKAVPGPLKYAAKKDGVQHPTGEQIESLKKQILLLVDEADPLGTITLPDGFVVTAWKVNGDQVKTDHDMDFVEAGNGYRWKFIPKEEFWVDDDLEPHDWKFNLLHESVEVYLMRQGVEYDPAHDYANRKEKVWRAEEELTALANGIECSKCGQHGCEHVCEKVAKYAVQKYAKKWKPLPTAYGAKNPPKDPEFEKKHPRDEIGEFTTVRVGNIDFQMPHDSTMLPPDHPHHPGNLLEGGHPQDQQAAAEGQQGEAASVPGDVLAPDANAPVQPAAAAPAAEPQAAPTIASRTSDSEKTFKETRKQREERIAKNKNLPRNVAEGNQDEISDENHQSLMDEFNSLTEAVEEQEEPQAGPEAKVGRQPGEDDEELPSEPAKAVEEPQAPSAADERVNRPEAGKIVKPKYKADEIMATAGELTDTLGREPTSDEINARIAEKRQAEVTAEQERRAEHGKQRDEQVKASKTTKKEKAMPKQLPKPAAAKEPYDVAAEMAKRLKDGERFGKIPAVQKAMTRRAAIAKIPEQQRVKTKQTLEKARDRVAKSDPKLAKVIESWLKDMADNLSAFWDIRNVNGALRRYQRKVKTSSPTRKNATHLPGGRMYGT